MGRERAASQRPVLVEELERGLLQPGGVLGMRGQHGGGVVRDDGSQLAGDVGTERLRFEQDEGASGGTGVVPALHVPWAYPQPLAGCDGACDVIDVVSQFALRDEDQVVEGGTARTGRIPRPVVVVGMEVLDGGHFQAVRRTDRGLEAVQRDGLGLYAYGGVGPRDEVGGGTLLRPQRVSPVDHHVSAVYRPPCRQRGKDGEDGPRVCAPSAGECRATRPRPFRNERKVSHTCIEPAASFPAGSEIPAWSFVQASAATPR